MLILCNRGFKILFLFLLIVNPLELDADDTEASSKSVPVGYHENKMYELGRTRAREHTGYPGTFVLGFVTGITIPVVSVGVGSFVYKSTGGIGLIGVAGGLASAGIWAKCGSKLTKREIIIPEYYHSNHNEAECLAFDAGYRDLAEEKRMSRFAGGAFIGAFVPIVFVISALSALNFD